MEVSGRAVELAVSEIRFGIEFGGLNERFWSHFDTCLNLFQALLGMLAVAGLLTDPTLIKAAGGALAVVSALQLALSPRKRSVEYRDARIRFHDLLGRAWGLEVLQLDGELEKVKANSPFGLRALRRPAYNIVAEALGSQELYKLSWTEAFAVQLAW